MPDIGDLWPFSELPPKVVNIYDGPEEFLRTFGSVTEQHRISFAAFWFQAEVLNGGLNQFFGNSTGVLAPEAAHACRTVGLSTLAAKIEEAMAWFGPVYPRGRESRNEALEAHAEANPDANDPFADMDDEVVSLIYDEGPGIEQSTRSYLEAHGR